MMNDRDVYIYIVQCLQETENTQLTSKVIYFYFHANSRDPKLVPAGGFCSFNSIWNICVYTY